MGQLALTVFVQMGRSLPFAHLHLWKIQWNINRFHSWQNGNLLPLNVFMESDSLVSPSIYAKDRVITGSLSFLSSSCALVLSL